MLMKVRERIRRTWKKKGFRYGAAGTLCLMMAAGIMALGLGTGARAAGTIEDLNNAGGNISSASEFELLRNASLDDTRGNTYTLTRDITISSVTSAATGTFAGTFDGGGHVITIEDINITDVDYTESGTVEVGAVNHGVLFGTVTGTVTNLIIDVTDNDASYTRISNAGVEPDGSSVTSVTSDGSAEYTPRTPISELDTGVVDIAAYNEIKNYAPVYLDESGQEVDASAEGASEYVKTVKAKNEETVTSYHANIAEEDGFGLVCGKLTGTVSQVSINGNAITVNQTAAESGKETRTDSVTTPYTHYYKVGTTNKIEAEDFSEATVSLGAPTVYSETVATPISPNAAVGEVMSLQVSAPENILEEEQITYTLNVRALNNAALTNVTLKAPETGTWTVVGGSETGTGAEFVLENLNTSDEIITFRPSTPVTGASKTASFQAKTEVSGQTVTASTEVTTTVKSNSSNAEFDSNKRVNATVLELTVSAPKAFVAESGGNVTLTYKVEVKNNDSEPMNNVALTVPADLTVLTDGYTNNLGNVAVGIVNSGAPVTLEFTKEFSSSDGTQNVEFSASAEVGNPAQKISATATATTIGHLIGTHLTESAVIQGDRVKMTASVADKAVYKDTNSKLIYTVSIENTSGIALSNVKVGASESGGTWSKSSGTGSVNADGSINILSASETMVLNYSLPIGTLTDGSTTTTTFTISEGTKSSTTEELSTTVYDGQNTNVTGTGTGQSSNLKITVNAPKAFLVNSDGTATVDYQVTVTNNESEALTGVTVIPPTGMTPSGSADIGSLDAGTTSSTMTFIKHFDGITDICTESVTFQVTATKGTGAAAKTLTASATVTSTGYKPDTGTTSATIEENKVTLTASVSDVMAYTGSDSVLVYTVVVENNTGAQLMDIQVASSVTGGTWSAVNSTNFNASTGKITSLAAYGSIELEYRLPISTMPDSGSQTATFTVSKDESSQPTLDLTTEVYDVRDDQVVRSSSAIDPDKLTISASAPANVKRTSGGTQVTYNLSIKAPSGKAVTITASGGGTWSGAVTGSDGSASINGTEREQEVSFVRTVSDTDSSVITSFSAKTADGTCAVQTASLVTSIFDEGLESSEVVKNTPIEGNKLTLSASAPAVVETGSGTAEVLYTLTVSGEKASGAVLYALTGNGSSVSGKWGTTEVAVRSSVATESTSFTVPEGVENVYYLANESADLTNPPAAVQRSFRAVKSETVSGFGIPIPQYMAGTELLGTKVYKSNDPVTSTVSTSEGKLSITLTGDTKYVSLGSSGKSITYSLELENTDSAKPMYISTDFTDWRLETGSWSTESYTTTGETKVTYPGSSGQILEPGNTVVLKKTVTAGDAGAMSMTIAGKSISITPVPTYMYSHAVTGDASSSTTYGSTLYAGNHLRAGVFAGVNSGTLEQCRQDMNITGVPVSSVHNDASLSIGGVIGENAATESMTDLYVNGNVEAPRSVDAGWITGTGGGTVESSVVTGTTDDSKLGVTGDVKLGGQEPEATWTRWKTFQYYTDTDTAQDAFDLAWLVKDEDGVFTYTNPAGNTVTISVAAPSTGKGLQYKTVYHARRTLNDMENQAYFSNTTSLNLGDSGYWQKVHAYATDGYYHYVQDYSSGESGDSYITEYPYRSTGKPVFTGSDPIWSVERVSGTLTDQVKLKLSEALNLSEVKMYYQGGTVEAAIENRKAVFPFEESAMTLAVVPVLNGKIYEEIVSDEFTAEDRDALPKPDVYGGNYYEANGGLKQESFLAGSSYAQGSELRITGSEEMASCSYAYCFSQNAPDAWNSVSWDGSMTKDADQFPEDIWSEIDGSMPITAAMEGTYYLYVKVSAGNYPDTVYCYGNLQVDAGASSVPKMYYDYNGTDGHLITGDVITEEDTLVFDVIPSSRLTKLEYVISGVRLEGNALYGADWKEYTGAVRMKHPTNGEACYIYTRMKDESGSTYGAVSSYEYTFAGKSGNVQISPRTVAVESEADASAAAVIPSGSVIYLDSVTADAKILYLVNTSAESGIQLKRVTGDVSGLTEDGKHFQIGDRWYQTDQDGVQVFTDQISLYNETNTPNTQYIHTVVLGDNLEPSEAVSFAYQVEPTEQAAAPEATLTTQSFPNGADVPIAEVEKDSVLSFSTLTPGGEMYYIIGNGEVSDQEEGAGGTRKYDSSKGIKVEGDYGSQFIISIKTVKWNGDRTKKELKDSDTIRFVYSIAEQGQVISPTATPETSRENPATVIPGDKILLSTATKGASIFYTTDGTTPHAECGEDGTWKAAGTSTKLYNAGQGITMPLEGSGYFTIRAIAVKTDLGNSPEVQFAYAFPDTVQSPYTNIPSGSVDLGAQVLLKNRTQGASIYYTVAYDGKVPDDPTVSSAVFDEAQPIVIQRETVIKALAVKDGVKSEIVTFRFLSMNQLDTPTASIDSGAMVSRGTRLKLSAPDGAVIYYTMDGSDPTDTGNAAVVAGKEITLDGAAGAQITIKAYARAEGKSDSDVVTFTYQISQSSSGVTADVADGTLVSNGSKVNLMTDVTGAKIYYTTDGSDPVDYGKEGSVVTVNGTAGGTFTIKAVAVADGEAGSISTFTYKIKEKPTAPSASPAGGVLTIATRVELSSSVEKIYYTTDGTTPTESSSLYKEPILINRTTNLQAIAVSEDGEISDVASYQYTAALKAAAPTASHEDGTVLEPGTIVALHTDTESARIYYSTNGTDPTLDNLDDMQLYTEDGIPVYRTVTIKAVAYREDMQLSAVETYTYRVDTIPAVEMKAREAAKLAEEELHDTDISELEREEDYDGTAYQSRVLREKSCNTVVSSTWNAIPNDAVLVTEEKDYSSQALENVKRVFGDDYVILNSYDICLMRGNTIIQPDGEVELGVPIPEKYKDAAVTIVYIDSDQKVTRLDTRRKDGMAYARVEHFSHYALVGLEEEEQAVRVFNYLLLLEGIAGVVLLFGIGYYIQRKWKSLHMHS